MALTYEKKQIAYNRSVRTQKIKYIVIHDTGNKGKGANAEAHYNYFNGGNRNASADFFVDSEKILQINDYKAYATWHVGDGKGKYGITNQNSIGIEICVNADGNYNIAFAKTVELVKHLMSVLNIPAGNVVRHYDASRKNCPASMTANNWAYWQDFKNRILTFEGELSLTQYEELKKEIEALKAENKVLKDNLEKVYRNIEEIPEWARPTVQKLIDKGRINGAGDNDLNLSETLIKSLVINDRAGLYGIYD